MVQRNAAAKSLQSCPTLYDPRDGSPPGSPIPGIVQARNTGAGCHFLLQCLNVKSESEVAQSCPTPSDRMECSLPGSSIHGIFQARVLEWVAIAFSDKGMGSVEIPSGWRVTQGIQVAVAGTPRAHGVNSVSWGFCIQQQQWWPHHTTSVIIWSTVSGSASLGQLNIIWMNSLSTQINKM